MKTLCGRLASGMVALVTLLAGCDRVTNSPHPSGAEKTNTFFTAFTERSPNYLDPTASYSQDETPYTYAVYEPLYRSLSFHADMYRPTANRYPTHPEGSYLRARALNDCFRCHDGKAQHGGKILDRKCETCHIPEKISGTLLFN